MELSTSLKENPVDRSSNISTTSLMDVPSTRISTRKRDSTAVSPPSSPTIQEGNDNLGYAPDHSSVRPKKNSNESTPIGSSSYNSQDSDVSKIDASSFLGNEDSINNMIETALKRCEDKVLQPYWTLLKIVGWRAWRKENNFDNSLFWRVINVFYTTLVLCLLPLLYSYEVGTCQWVVDIATDPHPQRHNNTTKCEVVNNSSTEIGCKHFITAQILPAILHFTSYIAGFYFFRIKETEHLNSLIEKVFLQAAPSPSNSASQKSIIVRLRNLLLASMVAWIAMSLIMEALFVSSFIDIHCWNTTHTNLSRQPWPPIFRAFQFTSPWPPDIPVVWGWIFTGLYTLCIFMKSLISLAIVLNYASQCEMLIFHARGIQLHMQERSGNLKQIMKDILFMRQCCTILNGPMSSMASLVCFNFAEMTSVGIGLLVNGTAHENIVWAYRTIFPMCWAIMLLFPLVQAARMNACASKFKKYALEIRVFGFPQSSPIELDSFLNFVSNTHLQAKLFQVPVLPSYLSSIVAVIALVFVLFLQMDLIGKKSLF